MSDEQYPPARGLPGKRRFKRGRDLEWGETPFDDLTRGELLRLVQAYHSALVSTGSCLRMDRAANPDSPYWGEEGSGGRALAKYDALMERCGRGNDIDRERIYRMFFRVADTLMFGAKPGTFDDWGIKIGGNEMIAPATGEPGYRPIRWSDITPKPPSAASAAQNRTPPNPA